MNETPQQYTQRILANTEGKDPLRVHQETPRKLAKAIARLEKKQMMRRLQPGKWSIAEVLAHLADAEIVLSWRLRQIAAENGATIQAFDQDVWATTFDYAHRDPKASLAVFRALREANVAMLKALPKDKWDHYGMHQERGKETLPHLLRMIAGHDLNHLAQIESMAKPAGKKRAAAA
ncbi:MAG TPA: DinB family protein [Terriglobales bacterium]|nr:DinB family protein [Terriglobales bacterium]